ncbi:MAG: 3-deoxy-7-phosphoheptulonate synthase [Thermoguttaceae bacterium]|nr:3-deoxy-7-phosphoheptulonate synthase [Thermoguttaceae bacterium]MDW8038225.1 3-deoxy-7-phosphoheptulonate synthase class II [Thermoguttaceae bacterium]
MGSPWSPSSWQTKPIEQAVQYPDPVALERVLQELSQLPPLVTSWEIERLKTELAEATMGKRFLLQGGDCSESFEDCRAETIVNKLKILLKMSLVLVYGTGCNVIRVGRIAGQYAKPRTSLTETRNGLTLPSFRGWLINRPGFSQQERTPDPELMLRGYERAALTLNFIRGLVEGGFADFHHPEFWDLAFVEHSAYAEEYRRIVQAIGSSIRFLETIAGRRLDEITRVEFYISHEGLHLPYEQAQTRQVPRRTGWYNLSAHFLWIGDRTRNPQGAHVEYFRGIANPIGVKIGPSISPEELVELVRILNPQNELGRLTLIHRFGVSRIDTCLPPLIEAIQRAGAVVLWCCDPMHGNTVTTATGRKTRSFDDILGELERAFDIHRRLCSHLGGVHFELTGENVTECTGGARRLTEQDLDQNYRTDMDPRLNYEQALEMAFLIASRLQRRSNR